MRFTLIDRITEVESARCISGIKNVTMSEDYFEQHFPYFPVMPGSLMLEAMIQLGSWSISESTQFDGWGRLSQLHEAKFRRPVQPGDCLTIVAEWKDRTEASVLFHARVLCEGRPVAQARFESTVIATNEAEKARLQKFHRFLTTRFA